MPHDNCEKRIAMKSIGNRYLWIVYRNLPWRSNFLALELKYTFPMTFHYFFLLPLNSFSRSNFSIQLINFYVRCINRIFVRAKFAVKMEYKWNARVSASSFHKEHQRKRYRTIPFLFYWNNCCAELTAKHRGENSIGRYSTSNSNVDHAFIKHCITKRESTLREKKYRVTK